MIILMEWFMRFWWFIKRWHFGHTKLTIKITLQKLSLFSYLSLNLSFPFCYAFQNKCYSTIINLIINQLFQIKKNKLIKEKTFLIFLFVAVLNQTSKTFYCLTVLCFRHVLQAIKIKLTFISEF